MYVGGPCHDSRSFNQAFQFTKSLAMPRTGDTKLVLCNGMDVLHGSVFDHRVI